jgi:circadian clock protein KaiC
MFIFDEGLHTLLSRADGMSMQLRAHHASGRLMIQQIDPAELSPGELVSAVRSAVEVDGARLIIIDSLNGYLNAMPGEKYLIIQLHELLTYLGQAGVATIMVSAHHGMIGNAMIAPVDVSYLADAVLLMRYFEAHGEVRQALSVLKKRGSAHERTIREFSLSEGRIRIGEPLRDFHGVLTGVPQYTGPAFRRKGAEIR